MERALITPIPIYLTAYYVVLIYNPLSNSWFDHIYYLRLSLARIELYFLCHSYVPRVDEKWPSLCFHFHRLSIKELAGKSPKMHICRAYKGRR